MISTSFDQANCVLGPPRDMTSAECESINVWRGENTDGVGVVISCWKMTKEELEELIKNGGRVWLTCLGTTMPPVSLQSRNPWV